MSRLRGWIKLLVGVGSVPAAISWAGGEQDGLAYFQAKVRPVLIEHCYECHSARIAEPKAGLRLDTPEGLRAGGASGELIVPGKPDESLLIHVLEHSSEVAQMPPKGKLSDAILSDIRKWVGMGAPGVAVPSRSTPKPAR